MTHPDAHRFDSDSDFLDHIHGSEKPVPYFDSDPDLADDIAWDKLPAEMLALCLLFAKHDYRCALLKQFHIECEANAGKLSEALIDGTIDTVPVIQILAKEDDSDVPQPLRAVCHWIHDKVLSVWEEHHDV